MSSGDAGDNKNSNYTTTNLNPMKTIAEQGERLVIENAFIISFDVFLLILCFDVLIAVILINFLMAGYALTEIIDSRLFLSRIISAAADYKVDTQISFKFKHFFIAYLSVLAFFLIVFTYFGYKLYREFEWHGFHQTGADSGMQAMYRNYSVFSLLVKLDFFFIWGFGIFYAYESYLNWNKSGDANPTATTIYLTVLVFLFPVIATLGFIAIRKENKSLMSIFLAYLFLIPPVFILGMIQTPIKPWAQFKNRSQYIEKGYQHHHRRNNNKDRPQMISLSRSQSPLRREEEEEVTLTITPSSDSIAQGQQVEPPKRDSSETIVSDSERMQWD
ncbi:3667_t:CDS:2 [Ambispora gerdemannii]|uniref:3667_t:CDS:1 n=1 Tax=Ambispora gerdemannii TaxID=144530 RepID=A0A9N8WQF1_9GLOM|nr:3667_t:CDS:2 [Ambispora gerdemannii]